MDTTRSSDADSIASLPPIPPRASPHTLHEGGAGEHMNTTEDGAQMAPGAPENGASSSTNPTTKPPARRRRAPSRRRTEAENATPSAETQTEASAEAHAEPRVEPAPAASSEAQPSANGATESASEQAERKTARPRRARNTKSRRPAVELVRPPTT